MAWKYLQQKKISNIAADLGPALADILVLTWVSIGSGLQREDAGDGKAEEEEQEVGAGGQSLAQQEPDLNVQSRRPRTGPRRRLQRLPEVGSEAGRIQVAASEYFEATVASRRRLSRSPVSRAAANRADRLQQADPQGGPRAVRSARGQKGGRGIPGGHQRASEFKQTIFLIGLHQRKMASLVQEDGLLCF